MQTKPKTCVGCPMYELGEGFVSFDGAIDAKIIVVGEAPGETEVISGKPFVGKTGKILRAMLPFRYPLITNVLWCRPPGNKIPPNFDVSICTSRYLDKIIPQHNRSMIVAVGDTAATSLFKKVPITRWRGSIVDGKWGKTMLTLHPSFIVRGNWELLPILKADLKKANSFVTSPQPNYIINPTIDQLNDFKDSLDHDEILAFDIENTYSGALICISFASKDTTICIPLQNGYNPYWKTNEDEMEAVKVIADILESDIPKVAQNMIHDISHLQELGFIINNVNDDTLVAHHVVYPELPHRLDFMSSIYTDIPFYKHMLRDNENEKVSMLDCSIDTVQEYNCKDSYVTLLIHKAIQSELAEHNLTQFYKRQMKLVHKLIDMSKIGVKVDVDKMEDMKVILTQESDELQSMFNSAVGQELNLASSKQIGSFLYGELGIKPPSFTPKGQPSTDEKALRKIALLGLEESELINVILTHKELSKVISTYLHCFTDANNRIHSRWSIGPVSGRLSSKEPNLQNLPKFGPGSIREIYTCETGNVLIGADYSQIELRILAYISGCETLIKAFNSGEDIHTINARSLYNKQDIAKDSVERRFAKVFVYSTAYGGGASVLQEAASLSQLNITLKEAKTFIDNFYRANKEIVVWRDKLVKEVYSTRRYTNCFGRSRLFMGNITSMYSEIINYPIQSTAADIINEAMLRIDLPYVAQIHDQLVVEVPEKEAKATSEKLKEGMEFKFTINGYEIFIPVDVKIGRNFKEI